MSTSIRKTEISRKQLAGGWIVTVHGDINETVPFELLWKDLSGTVLYDLGEVHAISSLGVREWVNAMEHLVADYRGFLRCHPSMVSQLNMVSNFAGKGEAISLYVPFVCGECVREEELLLDLRTQYSLLVDGKLPDAPRCSVCGGETEFDEDIESYFYFVLNRPPPKPTPAALEMIDGKRKDQTMSMRVRKEVWGELTAFWLQGLLQPSARFRRTFEHLEGTVVLVLSEALVETPEAMQLLLQAAHVDDSATYVARLPRQLVKLFSQARIACGSRAQLVSVDVSGHCDHCNKQVTFDISNPPSVAVGRFVARCTECGLRSVPIAETVEVAQIRGWLSPMPDPVWRYLRLRNKGIADVDGSGAAGKGQATEKYEKLKEIGQGGMGTVFLARQVGPDGFRKQVVLKQILPSLQHRSDFLELFLHEARTAARITHPNVVQVFDLAVNNNQYTLVMEYVEGVSLVPVLRKLHRDSGLLPLGVACRIVSDVAAGLHAAHVATDEGGNVLGVVHRDISPNNILLSVDGAVKVTDFGVSWVADSVVATTERIVGKYAYMAPEQLTDGNSDRIGPHTDVFALGVVFYLLLTGRPAFPAKSPEERLAVGPLSPQMLPTRLCSALPEELDAIVLRALAPTIELRYASAQELQNDIERFIRQYKLPATSSELASWLRTSGLIDDKHIASPQPKTSPSHADAQPGTETVSLTLDPSAFTKDDE